jgi:GNAT superfamily N-acetyltransferase
MELLARPASLEEIGSWRDRYRLEMNCQIIHDSIHDRPGWTQEYSLLIDGTAVGYGSMAIAGPWKDKPTVYEFYVVPPYRARLFDLFGALRTASGAVAIETQSNDILLTVMLHTFTSSATSESILFEDKFLTALAPPGAVFRLATPADFPDVSPNRLKWHGVVQFDGHVAATGGILFHYNRPYGDIFMEVKESFRRRGLGSFLVQELKRVCYGGGNIPAARCHPKNIASRKTLQKAGFVPCGHILVGAVES